MMGLDVVEGLINRMKTQFKPYVVNGIEFFFMIKLNILLNLKIIVSFNYTIKKIAYSYH